MLSRRPKESHLDTIGYEIDMLHLCRSRLNEKKGKWETPGDFNVYLEAYLLHYRNLIEFFGDEGGDLRVSDWRIWSPRALEEKDLTALTDRAPCEKYRGPISRYLQHINQVRAIEDRGWEVEEMHSEIEHLITAFEVQFPRAPQADPKVVVAADPTQSAHTATIKTFKP